MKKEKNIDELFRDKLQNFEQEPPAYLLEGILAGVAGEKKKRRLIYWRIAGVAAALLLAFVAGWQFNDREGYGTKQTQMASFPKTTVISPEKNIPAEKLISAGTSDLVAAKPTSTEVAQITSRQKIDKEPVISETAVVASESRSETMKPLKGFYHLILVKTGETANLILTENVEQTPSAEKTIDQQIMEQNQQMALIQHLEKEKGRWLVGAQVSPSFSVSRSTYSQAYSSNMLNTSTSNPAEFAGGLSVEYKPGKRWSVQSGVYYSGLGQTSGNATASNGKDAAYANIGSGYFNTPVNYDMKSSRMSMNSTAGVIELRNIPSGIIVGGNFESNALSSAVVVSNAAFTQNFEYIEIPLFLRYTIIDSRFDVEMLGGFSSNVLVGNQAYIESSSGKSLVGKTKDMETMNYSGTLGVGVKYGLSKHISVNVEPRVKYYLNSLNSNADVSYKPYTIGVFTGLSYEF